MAVGFVYLFPQTAVKLAISLERQRSGLVSKRIQISNGLEYAYLETGKGEPLLLLHGFGSNKDTFFKITRYLNGNYRILIPDHIGFGESSHPPAADYSPVAQAARLREFMRALGIQRFHIGGNSMGGQISLTYAALYPDEIQTLWLLNPSGMWNAPRSELLRILDAKGRNPLLVENEEDYFRLFEFVMHEPMFVPKPMQRVLAQERIRNYGLERKIFDQLIADRLEERISSGIATPTLIVWGNLDRTLSFETASLLQKYIPHSRSILMEGIGHLPMIERPRQTAEDYLEFQKIAPTL